MFKVSLEYHKESHWHNHFRFPVCWLCYLNSRTHRLCRMQCQSFQKFGRTRTVREVRSVYVAEPDRQASRVQELWQMSSLTGGICRKKNRLGLGGETSGYGEWGGGGGGD